MRDATRSLWLSNLGLQAHGRWDAREWCENMGHAQLSGSSGNNYVQPTPFTMWQAHSSLWNDIIFLVTLNNKFTITGEIFQFGE